MIQMVSPVRKAIRFVTDSGRLMLHFLILNTRLPHSEGL